MENKSAKPKFNDIVQFFNPAWFAAVMGTAVIPLAISFINFPGKLLIVQIVMIFSILLFTLIFIPWILKFIKYPANIKNDLNHPIAGNFFPTMPISLIVLSLDFLKYPTAFFSKEISIDIAYYLWIIGSIGIYIFGFIILTFIFRHKNIDLQHANFGWYIPPVSKLIIPVAGFELAAKLPQTSELTFGLSIVSLGVGFFLFLFVGAAVYHRYIYHELPMAQFASTFFIGIAPTAIIGVILFKMMELFSHNPVLGISPAFFDPIAKLSILGAWGFSVWWFIMAIIILIYYIRKIELPYALSWWAFTFPLGAQSVASGVAAKVTGYSSVYFIYYMTLLVMLFLWSIVLIRTVRGIWSREIFKPAH